mgnify:CR=1 FL=1
MPVIEIKTIPQLIKNLNMGSGYGGYIDLLKGLQLEEAEWKKYCHWEKADYSRNCLSSCDSYELLLLCWQTGQTSPIHNFDFQEGWIKVLSGELKIESYVLDRDKKEAQLKDTVLLGSGESTYLNDRMGFHRVLNSNSGNTASLHLNIARVEQWEVFDPEKKIIQTVKPKIHSQTEDCD